MAFIPVESRLGLQDIATTDTVQRQILGTIVRARDNTLGEGEFIYLLGIASTVVGSAVTYNPSTFLTTLSAVAGAVPMPLAFAMSANVGSQYGWYQIGGLTTAKKKCTTSLAAGIAVGILSTGVVAGTGTGKEVQGAVVAAVASNSASRPTVLIMINRPHKQGRIT